MAKRKAPADPKPTAAAEGPDSSAAVVSGAAPREATVTNAVGQPNPAAFVTTLRTDGFRVVNSSLRPNSQNGGHCHDFDVRLMVLGGQITLVRDGTSETFTAGQCYEVPAGQPHAEYAGPEGAAFVSGRRRTGPLTPQAFESDLRREGYDIRFGGRPPRYTADPHAHDFDVRLMVLGGEITLTIGGRPTTYRAGDDCEVPAGTIHAETVGPEGVSTLSGIMPRRAA